MLRWKHKGVCEHLRWLSDWRGKDEEQTDDTVKSVSYRLYIKDGHHSITEQQPEGLKRKKTPLKTSQC